MQLHCLLCPPIKICGNKNLSMHQIILSFFPSIVFRLEKLLHSWRSNFLGSWFFAIFMKGRVLIFVFLSPPAADPISSMSLALAWEICGIVPSGIIRCPSRKSTKRKAINIPKRLGHNKQDLIQMNAIRYTQKYTAVVMFKIQHSDAQWAQIRLSLSSTERKENETFSGGFQTL